MNRSLFAGKTIAILIFGMLSPFLGPEDATSDEGGRPPNGGKSCIYAGGTDKLRLMKFGNQLCVVRIPRDLMGGSGIRLSSVPRDGIMQLTGNLETGVGYDLTGESQRLNFGIALKSPATEWEVEKATGKLGYYLRVANGQLKGMYLDFEEKPQRHWGNFGGLDSVEVWRAKLSPKPGPMSNLHDRRIKDLPVAP